MKKTWMAAAAFCALGLVSATGQASCSLPIITLNVVSPSVIWPPQHHLVEIEMNGTIMTNCPLDSTRFEINDEYGGKIVGELQVAPTGGAFTATASVEGFKQGKDKDGRSYEVTAFAVNPAGTAKSRPLSVIVSKPAR